jgi:hypothetical protein
MKKFALVDKSNDKILHVYSSEYGITFGGPWGDSSKIEHIEFSPEAMNLSQDQVKVGLYNKFVSSSLELRNELVLAFDSLGQPILNENGVQASIPKYQFVETRANVRAIIPK